VPDHTRPPGPLQEEIQPCILPDIRVGHSHPPKAPARDEHPACTSARAVLVGSGLRATPWAPMKERARTRARALPFEVNRIVEPPAPPPADFFPVLPDRL